MSSKKLKPIKCVVPRLLTDLGSCGSRLFADRVRILLHNINISHLFARVTTDEDEYYHAQGWVTISSRKLEVLLTHEYPKIIQYCEDNELIEVKRNDNKNKSFVVNKRSTPYRINPNLFPFDGRRFRIEKIVSYKAIKSVLAYKSKKDMVDSYSSTFDFYDGLTEMLDSFYFDGLDIFLDELEKGNILPKPKIGQTTENRINNIIEASMAAELINDGQKFKTSVCRYGNRFHSVFTRIPSELRPLLKIKNCDVTLVSLDIKNSQALMFALAINFPDKVAEIIPEFKPMLEMMVGKGTDRRYFLQQSINGTLYDEWQGHRNLETRQEAKDEILKVILFGRLYTKYKGSGLIRSRFSFLYPDVFECISAIKTIDERTLPFITDLYLDNDGKYNNKDIFKNLNLMTQRLESRLVMGIVKKILTQEKLSYPFLTIHDSFVVAASDVEALKELINQHFQGFGLPLPRLSIEVY